jgi:hypothetical protein
MPNNYAVLVGINRYKGFIRHNGKIVPLHRHRLYGCVNDVEAMQSLLVQRYGFSESNTSVLTDELATREAILASLEHMIRLAAAGDRLLFYFSGHGSMYIPVSVKSRECRPFEILCPYDMDWDRECFVSGQDLKSMVNKLPERAGLEIVLDTCCAGGMKDVGRLYDALISAPLVGGLSAEPSAGRSRFWKPPPDVLERIVASQDNNSTDTITSSVGSLGPKRCVLWAASNDHQTSEEYIPSHGREHGAFTYFFTKLLNDSPAATRDSVLKGVTGSLEDERFSQTPQLFPNSSLINEDRFLEPGTF